MKSKKEIRTYIKNLFASKEKQELHDKSKVIAALVMSYIKSSSCRHIWVYEHLSDEVETRELIGLLQAHWYYVYTPQILSDTEMVFIDDEYNIYEKEIDIFLIPGRAFSNDGKRLGRGKWYYDRFLEKDIYKKSLYIWICFDFQLLWEIPTQSHDKNMNHIVTNKH